MQSASEKIAQVKSAICNGALISIAVLTIPALSISVSRVFEIGVQPAMFLQVFLAMAVWISCLPRKRLPYRFAPLFWFY